MLADKLRASSSLAIEVNFIGADISTSSTETYTFSSTSIGSSTTATKRLLFLAVNVAQDDTSELQPTLTVDGVSATRVLDNTGMILIGTGGADRSRAHPKLFVLDITGFGSTADIVVDSTSSTECRGIQIAKYEVLNGKFFDADEDRDSTNAPPDQSSQSVSTTDGSVVLAMGVASDPTDSPSLSGVTEDYESGVLYALDGEPRIVRMLAGSNVSPSTPSQTVTISAGSSSYSYISLASFVRA